MASVNHMPSLILSGSSAIEFLNPVAHINLQLEYFLTWYLWDVGKGRTTKNLASIFSSPGYQSPTCRVIVWVEWVLRGSTQQGAWWRAGAFLLFTCLLLCCRGREVPWPCKEVLLEPENFQGAWGTRVWRAVVRGLAGHQPSVPLTASWCPLLWDSSNLRLGDLCGSVIHRGNSL